MRISFLYIPVAVSLAWLLAGCSTTVSVAKGQLRTGKSLAVIATETTDKTSLDDFFLIGALGRHRLHMAPILEARIVGQGVFKVIDRSQIDKVLQEQRLQASALADAGTARNVGKLAGADYLMLVQSRHHWCVVIFPAVDEQDCEARILDVNTGEVVASLASSRFLPTVAGVGYFKLLNTAGGMADDMIEELVAQSRTNEAM